MSVRVRARHTVSTKLNRQKYLHAVELYDSGMPVYRVCKQLGLNESILHRYLIHYSNVYHERSYWSTQIAACKAFANDLRLAGAREGTPDICEFDRPRAYPRPITSSLCSSSAGWVILQDEAL